jgi:hypothetical protein
MREYGMITKTGEIIYKVKSENIIDAIKHFSFIKQISAIHLLELFNIEEIKK